MRRTIPLLAIISIALLLTATPSRCQPPRRHHPRTSRSRSNEIFYAPPTVPPVTGTSPPSATSRHAGHRHACQRRLYAGRVPGMGS